MQTKIIDLQYYIKNNIFLVLLRYFQSRHLAPNDVDVWRHVTFSNVWRRLAPFTFKVVLRQNDFLNKLGY